MYTYVYDIDYAMCCHQSPAFQYTNVFQIHLRAPSYLVACLVPGTDNIFKKKSTVLGLDPSKNLKRISMWGWMIDGLMEETISVTLPVFTKKKKKKKKKQNVLFRFSRLEPILGKRGLLRFYFSPGVGGLQ